jgi:hypothetical protein
MTVLGAGSVRPALAWKALYRGDVYGVCQRPIMAAIMFCTLLVHMGVLVQRLFEEILGIL